MIPLFSIIHLFELSEILENEYKFSKEVATTISNNYLQRFRQCPDNIEYALDQWRLKLFHDVLGDKHEHIINDVYKKWYQLRYDYLNLSPDVKSMLMNLRKHYLLAVISNGPTNAQWEKIRKLKLQSYFDLILVSGDLPWEKPDKNIFREACKYFGVKSHQCIMIGDKIETDILGGIEAELGGTIWIPLNTNRADAMDIVPDFTINRITDVWNLLPKTNKLNVSNACRKYSMNIPDLEDGCSNGSDGS